MVTDQLANDLAPIIGGLPYRMALAGGWIDQPFISLHNPSPPGSMVVGRLLPEFRFMDRAGMGTSTRKVALRLWGQSIPDDDPQKLMRELYWEENAGKEAPSGSQDMAGLVFPGISRLDYDTAYECGLFPIHVESCIDPDVMFWLSSVFYMIPVMQRPAGYNPLEAQNLDPNWIYRLGQSGKDCFQAILDCNLTQLGASMNTCMECWEAILPCTLKHPTISIDLIEMLRFYQSKYPGAMYSGCGGGYLHVVSGKPIAGAFRVTHY
jgi:hypothetical protein